MLVEEDVPVEEENTTLCKEMAEVNEQIEQANEQIDRQEKQIDRQGKQIVQELLQIIEARGRLLFDLGHPQPPLPPIEEVVRACDSLLLTLNALDSIILE